MNNIATNCYFKKGWCHSCGKAEDPGKELCYFDDPFWFPALRFRPVEDGSTNFLPARNSKTFSGRRDEIYKRDDYKCKYCDSPNNLTLDHIIPISKGGTNTSNNLNTCCESCNQAKGNAHLNYFLVSDYLKTATGLK